MGCIARRLQDTSVFGDLLRASGVPLLHNRSEVVRVRDQSIRFAGVPDLWSGDVDGDSAFRRTFAADDPAILLAHNPDTKDILADWPWDLMLSGHTHGGQVVLPMLGERFVPVRDKRFVAGSEAMERAEGLRDERRGKHRRRARQLPARSHHTRLGQLAPGTLALFDHLLHAVQLLAQLLFTDRDRDHVADHDQPRDRKTIKHESSSFVDS